MPSQDPRQSQTGADLVGLFLLFIGFLAFDIAQSGLDRRQGVLQRRGVDNTWIEGGQVRADRAGVGSQCRCCARHPGPHYAPFVHYLLNANSKILDVYTGWVLICVNSDGRLIAQMSGARVYP